MAAKQKNPPSPERGRGAKQGNRRNLPAVREQRSASGRKPAVRRKAAQEEPRRTRKTAAREEPRRVRKTRAVEEWEPPVKERPKRKRRPANLRAYRKALGWVMVLLGICVVLGRFQPDAILVNGMYTLSRGLFGFGFWLAAPALWLAGMILIVDCDRPVGMQVLGTLAFPVLLGALFHIFRLDQTALLPQDVLLDALWTSGLSMETGGAAAGFVGYWSWRFFSKPLAVVLLTGLFFADFLAAMELPPDFLINAVWKKLTGHPLMESADREPPTGYAHGYDGEYAEEPPMDDDYPPEPGYGSAERDGVWREGRRIELAPEGPRGEQYPFWGAASEQEPERDSDRNGGGWGKYWPLGGILAAGRPFVDSFFRKSHKKPRPDQVMARWDDEGEALWPEEADMPPQRNAGDRPGGFPQDASGEPDRAAAERPVRNGQPSTAGPRTRTAPEGGAVGGASAARSAGNAAPDRNRPSPAPEDASGGTRSRRVVEREIAGAKEAVSREIENQAEVSGEYRCPPLKLLHVNRSRILPGEERKKDLVTRDILESTLTSFGVEAQAIPVDPVHGPTVTRYEFSLKQGVKLSKITNLSDDIALALGVTGVRIAPIPSKNSIVGIEVPNRQVTPVVIRDVVESRDFMTHPSPTAFAVGKDIGGNNVIGSISDLPHVLIAGTTGSGKSVCTNSLIISLLYKSSPEQVRFIMIDPKMVELAPYNGIPHLLIPVVTDPRKAAGALQWAVSEMMRRYRSFSENNVKKLSDFNRLARTRTEIKPFPSVVVVIDELADLMMAAAKEVEEAIIRIAQMGRAAGIHLVIATQRPSADVITGLMKANIPSRIAFAVASSIESRIILDSPGAEKLVGRGDMLYAPLGEGRVRVQGCYISPEEIERVVTFVKQTSAAQYDDDVIAKIEAASREKEGKPPEPVREEEQDELLPAAVEIVLETGQASVSMLQRRLKLGYSRAARLVDQMEARKYVGPFEGSKPRQVFLTKEKWQELKLNPAQKQSL